MKLASRMVPAKAGLALVIAFQMWCMMLRPLSHLVVARTAPFYATGGQSAQQKFWMGQAQPTRGASPPRRRRYFHAG